MKYYKLATHYNHLFTAGTNLNAKSFFYHLFTKGTDKIHCRYEAPREEPREAHGYLALDYDGYMVALSVNLNLVILWENVKVSQIHSWALADCSVNPLAD